MAYDDTKSDIYFKLLLKENGEIDIAEMQWFDERDYDQKELLDARFATEEEAEQARDLIILALMGNANALRRLLKAWRGFLR